MTYGTINVDQVTNSDGITSGGLYGFKNRIINGSMAVDQRGSASAPVTASSAFPYSVDRWSVGGSSSRFTAQQVTTAPTGFSNSLLVTSSGAYSPGANEEYDVRQPIEANNMQDLAWGTASAATVTMSFWVRSSLTGTFGGALYNYAGTYSYPFTYTINSANTWEQKTITIAGPTAGSWNTGNTGFVWVVFSMGVGSGRNGTAGSWASAYYAGATGQTNVVGTNGATWYITGVQLEKGSTATSFDYRPYGTELALCQRYYISYGGNFIYERFCTALDNGTQTAVAMFTLPVVMRAAPTFGYSSVGGVALYNGTSVLTVTNFSADSPSTTTPTVGVTVASGLTAGYMSQLIANNSTSTRVSWSAEL